MSTHEARVWREYDYCAEWCAKRGLKGQVGDRLPDYISTWVSELINADPEAFEARVNDHAYGIAMEKHAPPEDQKDGCCQFCRLNCLMADDRTECPSYWGMSKTEIAETLDQEGG